MSSGATEVGWWIMILSTCGVDGVGGAGEAGVGVGLRGRVEGSGEACIGSESRYG